MFRFSIVCAFILVLVGFVASDRALAASHILTLETLQERLEHPIQQDGRMTIDLRQFEIDLSDRNAEFRDRFYSLLQTQLNRAQAPLNLDLSQSTIRGDFNVDAWGIKVQLVEEALSGLLTPEQWSQLQQKVPTRPLRQWGEQFQNIPYVTLARGSLKLEKTQFLGRFNASHTVFALGVDAGGARFEQESLLSQSYFLAEANFRDVEFVGDGVFAGSHFLRAVRFDRAQWEGRANFQGAIFADAADFSGAGFTGLADWKGTSWQQGANFSRARWRDRAIFSDCFVLQSFDFSDAIFESALSFRGSALNAPMQFQGASLLAQADFSNAVFARDAYLNVEGLAFEAQAAVVLGDTGKIGSVLRVSKLQGNERVLKSLVRNFRRLEQIADANQVDYLRSRLREEQLRSHLRFSPFSWGAIASWLGLSVLLLFSDYGTNFSLVLTVGLLASACFGVLFWAVDRVRRRFPTPILPTRGETAWMLGSFGAIALLCLGVIFQASPQPLLTLACLSFPLLPIPLLLTGLLYARGRYHDLMEQSYLMEDGEQRRLRLLIARLPIMPRFYFFRDRFLPILSERRWSWLNYYDFSLNNLLKFGFNDLRLRDRHLPGLVSALVWYQWSLGLLYIALLFWTLSRTIPGLNLLLYLG